MSGILHRQEHEHSWWELTSRAEAARANHAATRIHLRVIAAEDKFITNRVQNSEVLQSSTLLKLFKSHCSVEAVKDDWRKEVTHR